MCEDPGAGGTLSADELASLTRLFRQFEGASDPLAIQCREAESEFTSLLERLYTEKVKPNFESVSLHQFRSYARNYCRLRVSKEGPPFPSV